MSKIIVIEGAKCINPMLDGLGFQWGTSKKSQDELEFKFDSSEVKRGIPNDPNMVNNEMF